MLPLWFMGCVTSEVSEIAPVAGFCFVVILITPRLIGLLLEFWGYGHATIDRDGMTLGPIRRGRFARRPFHFEWAEIKRLKMGPALGCGQAARVRVRLDRPHRFWSLEFPRS